VQQHDRWPDTYVIVGQQHAGIMPHGRRVRGLPLTAELVMDPPGRR
jgi:hypothetical protein